MTPIGLNPLTPNDPATFASDPLDSTGATVPTPHALLWYGHIQETESDGTDGSVPANNVLGHPDGRNANATYWALGRQAHVIAQ